MTLFEELEMKFRSGYSEIIKRIPLEARQNKELNCDSYASITKEIKSIHIECNRNGFDVLKTTSTIIYELLNRNYFVYGNHIMACFIGYKYLEKMAQVRIKFSEISIDGINKNSTIDEIHNYVKTW
jgi:hypothetical protein